MTNSGITQAEAGREGGISAACAAAAGLGGSDGHGRPPVPESLSQEP